MRPNKEAPPKYAWLGAAGVAGELPSGVITQDGSTYVPQTGRPLQTEGIAPPIPINAATPFAGALPPWVAETAGTEGAQQTALAHQEQEAIEKADQPPGEVPFTPPSWWCGGEYGPCPVEGGGEEGGGGCSGGNACAASNHHCSVHELMGEPTGNAMAAEGTFNCNFVTEFQIEICILAPTKLHGDVYGKVECNEEGGRKGEIRHRQSQGSAKTGIFCADAIDYEAWVWGFAFGSGYGFVAEGGRATAPYECTGAGSTDAAAGLAEFILDP
jgi:hypothetical protein